MYSNVDAIAEKLIYMGRMGRHMPCAWDGARIAIPVAGPEGQYVGKILPGRGLLLSMDAKEFGIKKPMPFVFDRSPVMRAVDFCKSERKGVAMAAFMAGALLIPNHILRALFSSGMAMAITGYDDILNARANGRAWDPLIVKATATTVSANWSSLWQSTGQPGAGSYTAIPGGAVLTNASTGAWSTGIANPTGGNKAYILTFGFSSAQVINFLMLVDLLVGAGGIDGNLNTSQTINSTALTRYTSGAGVMMTFDITAALGASASNLVVTYTNQAGTGSRTTASTAMLASGITQRLTPVALGPLVQLQAGDYGVQSVQSLTLSAAMGAGGTFALNLYFPLAVIPGVNANAYVERDSTTQIDGIVELAQSSGVVLGCLNVYVMAGATSTGVVTAALRTCQG